MLAIGKLSQNVAEFTFPERDDENESDEEHDSYDTRNTSVMFCKPGFSARCEDDNFQKTKTKTKCTMTNIRDGF